MSAPYRHIPCMRIIEGVYMAAEMKQVTLHCIHVSINTSMHTHKQSSVYALQVCHCEILISRFPAVAPACAPIATLNCSSPQTHTYTSCPVCCSGCCCYGNHSIVQGGPCFPRKEKTPCQSMRVGSCKMNACMY